MFKVTTLEYGQIANCFNNVVFQGWCVIFAEEMIREIYKEENKKYTKAKSINATSIS